MNGSEQNDQPGIRELFSSLKNYFSTWPNALRWLGFELLNFRRFRQGDMLENTSFGKEKEKIEHILGAYRRRDEPHRASVPPARLYAHDDGLVVPLFAEEFQPNLLTVGLGVFPGDGEGQQGLGVGNMTTEQGVDLSL